MDSVIEAGKNLDLPSNVTPQLWASYVRAYFAGMDLTDEDEEDEEDAANHDPDEMITCCFCGTDMLWKNSCNPWPLRDDEVSRCCADCNEHQVLPARWRMEATKK